MSGVRGVRGRGELGCFAAMEVFESHVKIVSGEVLRTPYYVAATSRGAKASASCHAMQGD